MTRSVPEPARRNSLAAAATGWQAFGVTLHRSASPPTGRRQTPRAPTVLDRVAVVTALRAAGCVFAEEEAALLVAAAASNAELEAMVERRSAGFPLEQILGWAQFHGLRIQLEPGVFVPRRRTELLVSEAVTVAGVGPVVVDLCCGSGAIAAALSKSLQNAQVHAVDIDPVAVRCARRNLASLGGTVHRGDLFAPLPAGLRGRVDVVVMCAPYVPSDEVALLPPEARVHEPRAALDGGPDGLDVVRRAAAQAPGWLAPGGHLLTETGRGQVHAATDVFADAGLSPRIALDEERGATVVVGVV
jgi:release factor glutamine methyltransferase